jgi:hypothetical protein
MSDPVTSIRNIGPAFAQSCARAGIQSATQLRDLGADTAYEMMLGAGSRPHFIGYYVLVMGLQGRPWNDCQGEEKKALRLRFDAIKERASAKIPQHDKERTEFELILNEIGVIKGQ